MSLLLGVPLDSANFQHRNMVRNRSTSDLVDSPPTHKINLSLDKKSPTTSSGSPTRPSPPSHRQSHRSSKGRVEEPVVLKESEKEKEAPVQVLKKRMSRFMQRKPKRVIL